MNISPYPIISRVPYWVSRAVIAWNIAKNTTAANATHMAMRCRSFLIFSFMCTVFMAIKVRNFELLLNNF